MVLYSLTPVLSNGSWVTATKPVICEYPIIIDQKFLYRRGIRLELMAKASDELGFQREHEGEESLETYEIRVRAPTMTDVKNIIKNMREIAHTHDHSVYASIDIAKKVKYESGRGMISAIITAICYLAGMEI